MIVQEPCLTGKAHVKQERSGGFQYFMYVCRLSSLMSCIIAGPPGCGKSTAVRVVAAEMGFEVNEWEAPVPTLWSEHVFQVRISPTQI